MKVLRWLDKHLEEYLLVILLIILSCVMMYQVVLRYVFQSPTSWSDEVCRFCFVFSGFITAGYCVSHGKMLRVDVVLSLLPDKVAWVVDLISRVLTLIFFALMTPAAILVTKDIFSMDAISPALQIPLWTIYIAAPIGFILGVIRSAEDIYRFIRQRRLDIAQAKEGVEA